MKNLLKSIHLILTLKCEQSTRIVSESLDRDLSFTERWAVRMHYISCWPCRHFRRHLDVMRNALNRLNSQDDAGDGLSDQAKKRIEQALDQS